METTDTVRRGIYDFAAIEQKWQAYWEEHATYRTLNPGENGFDASKPKLYVLDMFPYPSGAGLHVGHPIGYCATDIISRFKRMCGYNVLHPIGFDAFGLPAEQYAVEHGIHPAVTTKTNIDNMRRQLKMFGFSYDWNREISTCEPEYYKFTQWIFLQLFNCWYDPIGERARPIEELVTALERGERRVDDAMQVMHAPSDGEGVAYSDLSDADRRTVLDGARLAGVYEVPVNWCPALGTVLSNEEVTNEGLSDRGNHPVTRRPLKQWMLRITHYADRLLNDLETLDWPESVKIMQRNWIGKSTGAEVDFPIASGSAPASESSGSDASSIDDFQAWRNARKESGFPVKPDAACIRIYTTRPDTLFGATYMVLAPEHPLVSKITTPEHRDAVLAYVEAAGHKSDLDRTADAKEKTGAFTGAYAYNPANGHKIPIWVADYVLMGYGTGAIMAVPGSDTRDFAFAKAFDLDIVTVVEPTTAWAEQVARLPKGTLSEIREAARRRISESIERWKHEGSEDRGKHIAFAEDYLKSDRGDMQLDAQSIRNLYCLTPRVFAVPFCQPSVAINSPMGGDHTLGDDVCDLNGRSTEQAMTAIGDWLESCGTGRRAVNYKLRDWLFSRQRYWGEPIPILHDNAGRMIPLDEADLPVSLPHLDDFSPMVDPDPNAPITLPLSKSGDDWKIVSREGSAFRRELNTMPQWAGSCWYYLRYLSPNNTERFCDPEAEKYWMPIDLYVGGAEHAVLHLLYARFWHKVLYDLGHITTPEPFQKLLNQGMVQAFAYRDPAGRILNDERVTETSPGKYIVTESGDPAVQIVAKMSKSLKNVVNPDDIISQYGADTFRLYEMFMGPIESSKPWNTRDVPGLHKLLQRIWRLVVDEHTGDISAALTTTTPDDDTRRLLHKTIKGVTEDISSMKFNTAIALLFEFVNELTPREDRPREVIEPFVLLLSPFAPHMADELWGRLGHEGPASLQTWPAYDPELAKDNSVEIAVQVMGKVKARIIVPADADDKTLERVAMEDEAVKKAIEGKTVRKVITVKGRLVNIVAN